MARAKKEKIKASDDLVEPVRVDYAEKRQESFEQIKALLRSRRSVDQFLDMYIEGRGVGNLRGISSLYQGNGEISSKRQYFALELARIALTGAKSKADVPKLLRNTLVGLNLGRNPQQMYRQLTQDIYQGLAGRRGQGDLGAHVLETERRSRVSPEMRDMMRHGSPEEGQDRYAAGTSGHNGNGHAARGYRR